MLTPRHKLCTPESTFIQTRVYFIPLTYDVISQIRHSNANGPFCVTWLTWFPGIRTLSLTICGDGKQHYIVCYINFNCTSAVDLTNKTQLANENIILMALTESFGFCVYVNISSNGIMLSRTIYYLTQKCFWSFCRFFSIRHFILSELIFHFIITKLIVGFVKWSLDYKTGSLHGKKQLTAHAWW